MDAATTTRMRVWSSDTVLVAFLALAPLAWCALFWSLVVRVWITLGEWPHARSGNPFDGSYVESTIDPKAFGVHADIVWFAFPFALLFALTALLSLIAGSWVPTLRLPRLLMRLSSTGTALAALTVGANLGGAWVWFLD